MYQVLISLALIQACWALGSAAPRQIATSPLPTPTYNDVHETPLPENTLAARHLLPRCDIQPCSYGTGQAETLQASVVTSTILSTTSVPCYITTYVTDSTTTTETIYSTETVTSTVTEKGTVYIIKYSPTPVIKSTVYESVIQITQTQTAMWVETEGAYSEETVTGDTSTIAGGTGGGYGNGGEGDKGGWKDAGGGNGYTAPAPAATTGEWKDAGGGGNGNSAPASSTPAPAAQVNAWTHASGTAVAVAAPAAGVNAAPGTAMAWSTAGASVTIAGQNMANWHNRAAHAYTFGWPMIILTVVSIFAGVMVL